MKTFLVLLVLFPIVLCFGLAYVSGGEERAFEATAERVTGSVKGIHQKTRSNGRKAEDITTVEVTYTTKENASLTAEAEVGYAVGLSLRESIEVLYQKAEPQKIQIRAGFLNRPGKVVFFTFFGAFWALLGLPLLFFIARAKSAATDPAAKERIERMKQEVKDAQTARENRSQ